MSNAKMTEDEFNLIKRTEYSLDSLYEWLEKCISDADSELRTILQDKIRMLIEKLNHLLKT